MQKPLPSIPFAWAWWAFDLGDARPCDGTYCQFPYDELPPLPPLDGTLKWLRQPSWLDLPGNSPDERASWERSSAEAREQVRDLATQAERLGLRLPDVFTRLMSAPELQARIPEIACSWFNLYEVQLDPCPGSEDGFIVRFLNDQQDCILWYLYLSRQGAEAVLAVADPYPDAPSNYLERLVRPDEDGPLTEEQRRAVLANTYSCAPSFEAFVYRWWLEGTISLKLDGFDGESLTEVERSYLAHYQRRGRRDARTGYTERKRHGGVYIITNVQSGKYLIAHAADIDSVRNLLAFAARNGLGGMLPPKLRRDLVAYGSQAFVLEILGELDQKPSQNEVEFVDDLIALEQQHRTGLDPSLEY